MHCVIFGYSTVNAAPKRLSSYVRSLRKNTLEWLFINCTKPRVLREVYAQLDARMDTLYRNEGFDS